LQNKKHAISSRRSIIISKRLVSAHCRRSL
jgi:hypothetical protein